MNRVLFVNRLGGISGHTGRATSYLIAFAMLAALAVLVTVPQSGAAQTPSRIIVSDVRHDPAGELTVSLLTSAPNDELTVLVDGEPRTATVLQGASPEAPPKSVVVVMEAGNNLVVGRLTQAKDVARSVIDALAPRDEVAVVTFSDGATVLTELGTDHAAARTAIDTMPIGGSSSLYSGVATGAEVLGSSAGSPRSIVLITYGWEWGTFPGPSRQESLDAVNVSAARVYPVLLSSGSDFDSAYASALASTGDGVVRSLANADEVPGLVTGNVPTLDQVTLTVDVPLLTTGTHSIDIQSAGGGASSSFNVSNDGLITTAISTPEQPGDPFVLQLSSPVPLSELGVTARIGSEALALGEDDSITVDPWAFEPGPVVVELSVPAGAESAWSGGVGLEIPTLEPQLSTAVEAIDGGQELIVAWRVQATQSAMLRVFANGETLTESTERELRLPLPAGVEVTIEIVAASNTVVRSETITVAAAPSPASSESGGSLPVSPLQAGIVIAVLGFVAAAFVGLRRARPWGRGPNDQTRKPKSEQLAEAKQPVGTPFSSSRPAINIVARHTDGSELRAMLDRGPLSIGASPQCDLTLSGPDIRFVHVIASVVDGERVQLHFLGPMDASSNDTTSGEDRLARQTVKHLGEAFELGDYTISIEEEAASQQATPFRQLSNAA